MKRGICVLFAAVVVFSLSGCEPQVSLFPIYTPRDTFFDKQLLGEWQIWSGTELKPGDSPGTIVFSASKTEYSYDVRMPFDAEKNVALITTARLVKLGNAVFVDFGTPNMDDLGSPFYPYPTVEGHVFGPLTIEGERAHIRLLSDDWTKNAIKTGKMPLAFHNVSGIIVSAETPELRKFAADYAEDDAAFSEIYTLARKSASH